MNDERITGMGALRGWVILLVVVVVAGLGIGTGQAGAAPARQDNRLSYGQVVSGRLDETNYEDNWHLQGHAGDLLLADMRATSEGLDPYLSLLNTAQDTMISDDDSGESLNARLGPFALPYTGEYILTASSYNKASTGTYTLQIINLNTAPTLKLNKPLVGVLDSTHSNDYFRLVLPPDFTTGSLLRLSAEDDALYNDPLVSLYSTNGLINETVEFGEATIDPLILVPGQVYAVVVSWNPNSGGGPYELHFGASAITLLTDGDTQSGSLDYDTSSRRHYFTGLAGQQVRLTVSAVDLTLSPILRITSVESDIYLFSNDGENTRGLSVLLTLPQDGLYQVEIGNGVLDGEPGSYTIGLEVVEPPGSAP